MIGIQLHETKIASLLLKIRVNRSTCNPNPHGQWVPKSTFAQQWLRSRKLQQDKYQWQKEINNQQIPPDIGTTINPQETDSGDMVISNSPDPYCPDHCSLSLLFR